MEGKGKNKFSERSLVLIKPDGVQRSLVGEIISRFEKKGLKIVAMKMVWPTLDQAKRHYDQPEEAMIALGTKTITAYKEKGIDLDKTPIEIAKEVQRKLLTYLTSGPIVAMVVEGAHAITHVRKIRGGTNPLQADIGSITGDYTIDSYFLADEDDRSVRNLAHASGSVAEAENEIKIWFTEKEILKYNLAIDEILYAKEWESAMQEIVRGNNN